MPCRGSTSFGRPVMRCMFDLVETTNPALVLYPWDKFKDEINFLNFHEEVTCSMRIRRWVYMILCALRACANI